jgi:Grx4 family monothiol glutaredoxin
MNDVFAELATKYPTLKFLKIEAENFPDISESFQIAAVPSFIFIKNGKVSDRVEGANAPELSNAVAKYSKTSTTATPAKPASATTTTTPKVDLETRLKTLVNNAPVMIFIKGTPQQPRCGFSQKLVDLLAELKVKYSSFNILADEDIRQGLKTFSDWPTFPQVYINGEFVGGLDVVTAMIEAGEFQQLLPKEKPLNEYMQELIEKSPTMVFIKGTPAEPRCGFSRQLVGILADKKFEFGYFDILSDDDVRQGLKTHVNWPTYPMLFHKGELIGGLDIVKEMVASGEFDQALSA